MQRHLIRYTPIQPQVHRTLIISISSCRLKSQSYFETIIYRDNNIEQVSFHVTPGYLWNQGRSTLIMRQIAKSDHSQEPFLKLKTCRLKIRRKVELKV